jgi:hypothetical protein
MLKPAESAQAQAQERRRRGEVVRPGRERYRTASKRHLVTPAG